MRTCKKWKLDQFTEVAYKRIAGARRDKIIKAKAQNEIQLARDMTGNKELSINISEERGRRRKKSVLHLVRQES